MKNKEQDQQTADKSSPISIEVPKGSIVIIRERCKSCGFCIEFCPTRTLEFSSDYNAKGYRLPEAKNPEDCILCGFCTMYCPDFAIYHIKNKEEKEAGA